MLWDLDGTLIDSRAYHWRSWAEVMRGEGVVLTEPEFEKSFGQRNDTILAAWLGADAAPERVRRIGDAKEARYRGLVETEGIAALPGAADWVRSLHAAGWRQAIASSAPRLNVRVVERALAFAGLIEAVVGAEDVRAGKPDPEVFLTAARRLGVAPHRCVVQVKSGHVSSATIRDLKGTVEREKADLGLLITLEEPSGPMKVEALEAGFYRSAWMNQDYPRIQLLTVADLLRGRQPQIPPRYNPYQLAQFEGRPIQQTALFERGT